MLAEEALRKKEEQEYKEMVQSRMVDLNQEVNLNIEEFISTAESLRKETQRRKKALSKLKKKYSRIKKKKERLETAYEFLRERIDKQT